MSTNNIGKFSTQYFGGLHSGDSVYNLPFTIESNDVFSEPVFLKFNNDQFISIYVNPNSENEFRYIEPFEIQPNSTLSFRFIINSNVLPGRTVIDLINNTTNELVTNFSFFVEE